MNALRELADYLETPGNALPREYETAVRRIVVFAKVRADIREWQDAKATGGEKTLSSTEARKLLGL